MRGVLNDALSIYFLDPTLASAFVARWCAGYRVEAAEGVFQVREEEQAPRVGTGLHRTPRFSAVTSVAVLYRSSGGTAHPAAAKVAVKSWAEQVSDLTCLRRPTQNLTRAGRIGPRA